MRKKSDPISKTFAALSDPTRRAILSMLLEGPKVVTDLSKPFTMSAPAFSKHLSVLEDAELITREINGTWRIITLNAPALSIAQAWFSPFLTQKNGPPTNDDPSQQNSTI